MDMLIHGYREVCTRIFIAALFVVAKGWKQPKRPSIEDLPN